MTTSSVPETAPSPAAPRVAAWSLPLRGRLALVVTLSVLFTVGGTGWVALRLAEQSLTDEVREVAVTAAERAVDEIELLPEPLETDAVELALREVESVTPEVETISVVAVSASGPTLVATSGIAPIQAGTDLAVQSARDARALVLADRRMVRAAAPIRRGDSVFGAVVVRADLGAVIALQQRALGRIVGFAVLSVLLLVVVVDMVARPLIYVPLNEIRRTMTRVAAGDHGARAVVRTRHELGEVADRLNEMLDELEGLNDSLHDQVREATSELRAANEEVVATYGRVFGLREQLASAEQLAAVGQTAANVAHQVGTPLNLISGYVQMLKEEVGPDSPLLPRLSIIEEQAGKVASTVRTLLDRSRRMGPRAETSARAILKQVVTAMQPTLSAAGVTLRLELPATPTSILADVTSLELALLNLMTNAVDAMPGGGTLTVSVDTPSPDVVRIRVADSGQGIPEDLLPRIFEAWVSTKKPGRGTGLGLAITRDVVQGHGGTIRVASEVGRGTTFTIELPSAERTAPAGSPSP
ncbi:MAG: sensor histidine kinase [Vicinamibacterales bacterium]